MRMPDYQFTGEDRATVFLLHGIQDLEGHRSRKTGTNSL